jgi:hypothetical protein
MGDAASCHAAATAHPPAHACWLERSLASLKSGQAASSASRAPVTAAATATAAASWLPLGSTAPSRCRPGADAGRGGGGCSQGVSRKLDAGQKQVQLAALHAWAAPVATPAAALTVQQVSDCVPEPVTSGWRDGGRHLAQAQCNGRHQQRDLGTCRKDAVSADGGQVAAAFAACEDAAGGARICGGCLPRRCCLRAFRCSLRISCSFRLLCSLAKTLAPLPLRRPMLLLCRRSSHQPSMSLLWPTFLLHNNHEGAINPSSKSVASSASEVGQRKPLTCRRAWPRSARCNAAVTRIACECIFPLE